MKKFPKPTAPGPDKDSVKQDNVVPNLHNNEGGVRNPVVKEKPQHASGEPGRRSDEFSRQKGSVKNPEKNNK